jgi:hypothetical protein
MKFTEVNLEGEGEWVDYDEKVLASRSRSLLTPSHYRLFEASLPVSVMAVTGQWSRA